MAHRRRRHRRQPPPLSPPPRIAPPADDKPSIASDELKDLDAALGGALSDIVRLHDFKGEAVSEWGASGGGGRPPPPPPPLPPLWECT